MCFEYGPTYLPTWFIYKTGLRLTTSQLHKPFRFRFRIIDSNVFRRNVGDPTFLVTPQSKIRNINKNFK